ncbi:3-hydroxyacyl-ACP dehydratase FabZ [Aquibacillus sp. 3ASR75-11]|uniref:3-hydroxyacyl-[acyl-carrier-protein] dehydratase n=1 Tax=Terrihalobacillus insolitus TaxID=2950438 RepID=A0A9X3WW06_9BACI|nr:3-hydroxyacyl-ACP dehydratase FabZ [Terrihalobacillus insolitus]MDC3425116.1 3-hydroxyacyl-ACP dehydratase FabZ [Terrihalobacillus insolitus]
MLVKEGKKKSLTFNEILEILPQRYPMLLIDRVIEINDKEAHVVKNVSGNDPFFLGHFPQQKIFPGVLITEAMAQASIVLLANSNENAQEELDELPLLYRTNIKFLDVVTPGDQLLIKIELQKKVKNSAIVEGKVYVKERLVSSGILSFTKKVFEG